MDAMKIGVVGCAGRMGRMIIHCIHETAGAELAIPHGQTIAAYAVGDAHTNLLNPFWAIPLLAITGLRAREMFGYGITMMLLLIPFLAPVLYFLPY